MMTPEQIDDMRAEQPNHYGQRLPTIDELRAAIIAQAAEIERLKSGIPWREGPPPEEWRDGRQVLIFTLGSPAAVAIWIGGKWTTGIWNISDSVITHHAAITKPGE